MQPGRQSSDLGHGRRQAGLLLSIRPACQVTGERKMSGNWLGKGPRGCPLLKLPVTERGSHQQPRVAHVAIGDRRGSEDAERSTEELTPVRIVLLAGVLYQARELSGYFQPIAQGLHCLDTWCFALPASQP